jgi:hypothetical protein
LRRFRDELGRAGRGGAQPIHGPFIRDRQQVVGRDEAQHLRLAFDLCQHLGLSFCAVPPVDLSLGRVGEECVASVVDGEARSIAETTRQRL